MQNLVAKNATKYPLNTDLAVMHNNKCVILKFLAITIKLLTSSSNIQMHH